MKKCKSLLVGAAAVGAALLIPSVSHAQTLINSFTPGIGPLVGIGFDSVSGNVFVYPDFSDAILEYTPAGTQVPPDITNPGTSSTFYDLDFATASFNLGGSVVGANTLLVVDGNTNTLFGINKDDGTLLSSVVLSVPSSVGGSYHTARNTFFNLSDSDDTIYEIDPETGAVVSSFSVAPGGSPAFGIGFGDVEVNQNTGNLYLVSDSQNLIRELTPSGVFVQDIDLSGLGISGMAGIGFDDANSEAFISSTDGNVYQLGDLPTVTAAAPEPGTLALLAGGMGLMGLVRRRRTR